MPDFSVFHPIIINFINLNVFVKIKGISGKQIPASLYEVYMLKKGMNSFKIA